MEMEKAAKTALLPKLFLPLFLLILLFYFDKACACWRNCQSSLLQHSLTVVGIQDFFSILSFNLTGNLSV